MKITTVDARGVAVPLKRPTRIATRMLRERHFVLVEVRDEDGSSGVGYAYAGTSGARILVHAVCDLLAPVLLTAEWSDIGYLWRRMYNDSLLLGRRGALLRAISAIDIALWDLRAKRCGVPLAVLLGGDVSRPVPAYASGGYYCSDDGAAPSAVAAEIASNRASGFRDHKIKVGGLSVEEDAERVAAAIETMAGEGRLALDANNAYADVTEALRAARAFERAAGTAGLWWLEEPLSPDNFDGHAELARTLDTPVATGEIHQTRWDFATLIQRRAADILQPDAGVTGGVSEFLRIAATAASYDLPIAPHWHANLHAHLAASLPNVLALEHFALEKDIYNFEALVDTACRLRVDEGSVTLSDRPGLGLEFDDIALARYEIASDHCHRAPTRRPRATAAA